MKAHIEARGQPWLSTRRAVCLGVFQAGSLTRSRLATLKRLMDLSLPSLVLRLGASLLVWVLGIESDPHDCPARTFLT